jgi:hypothetical protein
MLSDAGRCAGAIEDAGPAVVTPIERTTHSMPQYPVAFAILLAVTAAAPAAAQEPAYVQLNPGAFQSFVRNWAPPSRPLCAAIRSQAEWDTIMSPAATMGSSKPFGPPADFWSRRAVLLVARVVDAGDMAQVFRLQRVRRAAGTIDVEYNFTPPPKASSTMKWWLGVEVLKPLAATIRFVEAGHVVCTLEPASGAWRTMTAP